MDRVKPLEVIDLPKFGCDQQQEHAGNFRFSLLDYPETKNLAELPKLVAIKHKGNDPGPGILTAIQLVFEHGIESPEFDSKYARQCREYRTTRLEGHRISQIVGKA